MTIPPYKKEKKKGSYLGILNHKIRNSEEGEKKRESSPTLLTRGGKRGKKKKKKGKGKRLAASLGNSL